MARKRSAAKRRELETSREFRRPCTPRADRLRGKMSSSAAPGKRARALRRHALPQRGGHPGDLHRARRSGSSPSTTSTARWWWRTTAAPTALSRSPRRSARGSSTSRSKGYGSALMGGISAARGRFVLMGDADDSYDFLEIPKFIGPIREGNDLVQGCRLPAGGGTVLPGRHALPAPLARQPDALRAMVRADVRRAR